MEDETKVGDFIKVFLPGESPWAEVVEVMEELVCARIDNVLFNEQPADVRKQFVSDNFDTAEPLPVLHNYKCNDVLWFKRGGKYSKWMPVEVH